MSRADLLKSSIRETMELEEEVKKINYFYKISCMRLGITPGDRNRQLPTEEEKLEASKYFNLRTEELRGEIKTYTELGYSTEEALERVLPKAYGLVKAASDFLWKKPHYDSQLKGGILLNDGYASEMATGEGKTLTATLPTYLNALLGEGAHVLTPNGYLARRDFEEMSQLYELLGLSCGLVEERTPLSEEAIVAKQRSILEVDIEKYTASAKTEEERKELAKRFFTDRKNQDIIKKAREQAREALSSEDKVKRKKAYAADITYGASSVVAFDYLYDDIEIDPTKMVQRKTKPNFVVIDEVDAVLFDDATMPYTISGYADDKERDITEDERKEQAMLISTANSALMRIDEESSKLETKYGGIYGLIEHFSDTNYQNLFKQENPMMTQLMPFRKENVHKQAEFYFNTKAIIINKNTKEFHITELGETIFFQHYCDAEVRRILKKHAKEIQELNYNGELVYQEGENYSIDKDGNLVMEPLALNHLILSGHIPELTTACNDFIVGEFRQHLPYINNAIMSWHVLEEDVDYKLSVPKDAKSANERIITLVTNGRTAEGRVYSNGLQQALEAKVAHEKREFKIKENQMTITLASIPTASFFSRYKKIAGMTGTSAISAFRTLYGLETKAVPRNKPKRVIDHGEVLYPDEQAKLEGILEEVAISYQKGQPILITATTIEKSETIAKFLNARLKDKLKEKYPQEEFSEFDISVLNANVNLEEEAKIVAQAGRKGAITIATEMAGRGTDIKLGGDPPEVSDLIPVVARERANDVIRKLVKDKKINTVEEQQHVYNMVYKDYLNNKLVRADAIRRRKEEIEKAGGLKVIGVGHFKSSRNDDQVKGRCGRQGDPGEVIFINDPDDLKEIGIPISVVEELTEKAKKTPIIETPQMRERPMTDAIEHAQNRIEGMKESHIKYSQEIEAEISRYRRDFSGQKAAIKRSGNYIDVVEFMIEETVKTVIMGTSPEKRPNFTDKTPLHIANLDIEELVSLSQEYLGISVDGEKISEFRTLGELRNYLTEESLGIFRERVKTEGKDKVNADCKMLVNKMFGRIWSHFEEFVEVIKEQESLNRIGQYQGGTELPTQILEAYKHAVETERGDLVRLAVNTKYRKNLENAEQQESLARKKAEDLESIAKTAAKTARRAARELASANASTYADKEKAFKNAEETAKEQRKLADQAALDRDQKKVALVKAKSRREIFPVRVLPQGVEKVSRDYDQQEESKLQSFKEESADYINTRIKNLRPYPKLFTIVEQLKINKNSAEMGEEDYRKHYAQLNSAIESVDFSDQTGPKGKK